ncbi:unnamed protein product [Brachionus calyciflorus]|uniref:Long-chain-fatty-acid--CoA ligase n=1 Tax=Brachionus calyciflorus TaxID=104777 RepID=A0A813P614_9BILA|nr:unnamed protein product [Brachionus calyciflorus]
MNSDDKNQNLLNQVTSTLMNTTPDLNKLYAVAGAALVSGALYYYLNSGPKPKRINGFDYENQTKEVQGRTDGARICTLNESEKLVSYYYEDGKTLYDLFKKGEKLSNDGPYLGWKPSLNDPYKWLKYSEVASVAEQIGSCFIHLGLEPSKETFIGIYAKNRLEWSLTEIACNTYSMVSVPLYDTLGLEAINFILVQTQLKLVVCDDSEKALQLMNTKSNLEFIIVIDKISEEARNRATELNLRMFSFDEVKQIGKENLRKPIPPKPEDLATICYTSGTTGTPKGALITHTNIVSISASMCFLLKKQKDIRDGEERYLSYLPLAHMFERVAQATLTSLGGSIGFYQGDVRKLVNDLQELKPTIFCTVPRLLNRIYASVTEKIEKSSALKKAIFRWAFAQKEKEVAKGIVRNDGMYDFAFKKIRESLGGQCKMIITGSAPISPEILHFLRVVTGCIVVEGYGATETGGACSVQLPYETSVGNIGPPFACCMYKLIDVPEMNLVVSRDNRGEVCVLGHNIFKGYYKDEEKTKAALDSDGWYHTGDIGMYDKNGCLKIVDRVKNIFKLQQGEYIAPEKIENIYIRSKYVAQVFIYGNSLKSSLVSIIVPEETVVYEWAKQNNVEANFIDLCKNSELKKTIIQDVSQIGKAGGLKGFEQARDIHLHHELFSIDNGLLTPTMKSKRNELLAYFREQIDVMYKSLD